MNARCQRVSVSILLPVVTMLLLCQRGVAVEDTLDSIGQQFETRQRQLRQISGRWRSTIVGPPPAAGIVVNVDCRFAVKDDKRLYDARYTQAGREKLPDELRRSGMSYDGRETRIALTSDHGRIFLGDERDQYDAPDDFLALQGYPKDDDGLWIEDDRARASCDLAALLRSTDYTLEGHDDVAGTPCIRVVAAADRCWLDPARGHAIRQREIRNRKGELRYRFSFDDFAEFLPGLWLARRITTEYHAPSGPTSRARIELIDASVDEVPGATFAFEFEPGTHVADMRHLLPRIGGGRPIVGYDWPARPEDLDRVVAQAVKRTREAIAAHTKIRGNVWWWALLFVNVAILLTIGVLLGRARRRRSGSA